jgi:predicted membrane protein
MIIDFFKEISDTIGIIGVVLLLLVYFLLSTNRISSKQMAYQLFNLAGASCILFSLLFHFNLASILLEIAWISISATGIYKIRAARQKQKTSQSMNVYSFNEKKKTVF